MRAACIAPYTAIMGPIQRFLIHQTIQQRVPWLYSRTLPASLDARTMNNASSIAALLAEHDLSTYAEDFEEHGWDSLTALQNISDGDLEQLIADVAMKSGHISRLRKALGKAPVARATAPPAVGPAEAQGVPDPVPGAAAAQPAAAGQPAGDATGGQPAPAPAMSADQAMLQRKLHMKLTSTNVLGQLEHGTIINTYQSGTELMIRIVSEELFYCACCAIPPRSGDNAGARRCGLSFCNVYSHMGSKEHFNSFRRRVFDMPFDATAWYKYTMSNKHGPRRAQNTVQQAKRAASAELKRDSKKSRGNDTPPPGMSTPDMSTPVPHDVCGVSPQPRPPLDSSAAPTAAEPAFQTPTGWDATEPRLEDERSLGPSDVVAAVYCMPPCMPPEGLPGTCLAHTSDELFDLNFLSNS